MSDQPIVPRNPSDPGVTLSGGERVGRTQARAPVNAHPTVRFQDLLGVGASPLRRLLRQEHGFHFPYKARGGLEHLLRSQVGNERTYVLVPAFHCVTIVQSVLRAGFRVRFYRVNRDLSVDPKDLDAQVDEDVAAIVQIRFFGFEQPDVDVAQVCRRIGAWFFEDCTHSFLRAAPLRLAGDKGDAVVYSLSKLTGGGAGGAIRVRNRSLAFEFPHQPLGWGKTARLYKRLLEQAVDNLGSDSVLRRIVTQLETWRVQMNNDAPIEQASSAAAAPVSLMDTFYPEHDEFFRANLPSWPRRVAEHADLKAMLDHRRGNYAIYLECLAGVKGIEMLFPTLDPDTCPWGFPVLMEGRQGLDRLLQEQGVPFYTFGEVLHPALEAEGAVAQGTRDDAIYVSSRMICFPIHQQIEPDVIPGIGVKIRNLCAAH